MRRKIKGNSFGYGNYKVKNRVCVVGSPQDYYLFIESKAGKQSSKWLTGKQSQRNYYDLLKLYNKNKKNEFIDKVNTIWEI